MKIKPFLKTCALAFGITTFSYASDTTRTISSETIQNAAYIKMISKPNSSSNFEQFMKDGAQLIRQTEPNTVFWFALKKGHQFAIFDVFFNIKGREQHFAGQVANALKKNASQFVQSGWEEGVLQNISNFDIIASNHFIKDKVLTSKEASYITIKAKPGKNRDLELFFKEASRLIDKTEPQTYFWVALKINKDSYAIFDVFPDKAAQQKHFSNRVASELQKNAENLIVGGWEKGIVANIHNFQIIAVS